MNGNVLRGHIESKGKKYYNALFPAYNPWGFFSDESNSDYFGLEFLSSNGEKLNRKDPNFYFPTDPSIV